MYYELKNNVRKINKREYSDYVMGVDIGGTNTRISVAGIKQGKPVLLFSMFYKSKEITEFENIITQVVTYASETHRIKVKDACIAAAGPVSDTHDYCSLTNLDWVIDAYALLKKTPLKSIIILNDFEAIGYGIDLLNIKNKNESMLIKKGNVKKKKGIMPTMAVIGAGTGFGKATLVYKQSFNGYIPVASEGGHADFPIHDSFDLDLVNFIKKNRINDNEKPVSYEDLISGRGIINIYEYLKSLDVFEETPYTRKVDAAIDKPEFISAYQDDDKTCREVFRLVAKYFGRAAKNFALNSLPTGGLFIAGGIPSKNKGIFKEPEFIEEFENAIKQRQLLKNMPIYLVMNIDINLLGACFACVSRRELATKR